MAKENLVIIQFESEDFYIAVVDQILFNAGLEVSFAARNKSQASSLIEKVVKGELKPDIAIIDTMLENTHTEGEVIAKKLKEVSPDTKIIAYTILDDTAWGDYVAVKSNRVPAKTLIKGLTELTGLNFTAQETGSDFGEYA